MKKSPPSQGRAHRGLSASLLEDDLEAQVAAALNLATPDVTLIWLAEHGAQEAAFELLNRLFSGGEPTAIPVVVNRHNGYALETTEHHVFVVTASAYSPTVLRAFAASEHEALRQCAAMDPASSQECLAALAADDASWIRAVVAANPSVTPSTLLDLAGRGKSETWQVLAQRADLEDHQAVIDAICMSKGTIAQSLLVSRPGMLDRLLANPLGKVRAMTARYVEEGDSAGWQRLFADAERCVREAAGKAAPESVLNMHAEHSCVRVRALVAQRTTSAEVLDSLAQDEQALVRRRVTRNLSAGLDLLTLLIADEDAVVRKQATERFLGHMTLDA